MRVQGTLLTFCVLLAACETSPPNSEPTSEQASQTPQEDQAAAFERLDPRFDELIPPDAVLENLGGDLGWAEGPVWDDQDQAILISDVVGNTIYRWKEGEEIHPHIQPSGWLSDEEFQGREPGSNGLEFDSDWNLILAQHGERQIARLEDDSTFTTIASHYQGQRLNSPNDLAYGPNGDLYFTDPPYGLPGTFDSPEKELDVNGVYRVDQEGNVHLLTDDLNAPNGIGFSPDGATMYVASTDPTQPYWMAYPVLEDGSVGEGSIFRETTESGPGGRDGLDLDENGNLFATGPGGVHVIAPDGTLLGRILTGVPTANVTWGDDGSTLYIAANSELMRVRTATRGMVGFQHRQ